MKIEPTLRFCRFEQLSSGDLFVYMHDDGSCIALKVEDPHQNGEKLILPFGPAFPKPLDGPNFVPWQPMDVISFRKDYILQLPAHPGGWSKFEPTENILCILMTDKEYYLRTNFVPLSREFRPAYVDMSTGLIHVDSQRMQSGYTRPTGVRAVAMEWTLITTETEPRIIFSQTSTQPRELLH
jgi:hypothetical protein